MPSFEHSPTCGGARHQRNSWFSKGPKYKPGSYVKKAFKSRQGTERMWVRVSRADDNTKTLIGSLDNVPALPGSPYHLGQEVRMQYSEIIGTSNSNPAKFDRCVRDVQAHGGPVNAYAVCTAAGTRNKKRRGKRGNPPNPEDAAQDMYESFHGKPATSQVLVKEEYHVHEHLATLGVLVSFRVATVTGLDAEVESSDAAGDFDEVGADDKTVFLASNEQGTQLYFVGGDQSLDLARLKFTGDLVKDDMVIGILYEVTYRTRKKFDKFQLTEYYHELGEETGDQPFLRYDSLSPHLAISGGKYKIKMPLIGMSPGIEN